MSSIYRIFLMLLVGGGALACVTAGWSHQEGVIMAGGLAALLCLAGLAAPLPRGAAPRHPLAKTTPAEARRDVAVQNSEDSEGSLVGKMLAQGRYALLLRPQIAENLTPAQLEFAHEVLDGAMAVVPEGGVVMRSARVDDVAEVNRHKVETNVEVEGYYLDRFPVTNREYQKFVDAGGYEQLPLWDESIWPAMLQFVDRTGNSGPRMWEKGRYPGGKEDHPVVGISWFEASAYAHWAGKRLVCDEEWVKAVAWPVTAKGARLLQRKFPWGDAMERTLANLWGSGPGGTVPVTFHAEGASVGGVLQMVGNVWEWTSTDFGVWEPLAVKLETDIPLKSLRGGAFDTYFEAQAQCQFQSGDSPLARKPNIGFRCAVGFSDVLQRQAAASPAAEDDEICEPGLNAPAENKVEVLS